MVRKLVLLFLGLASLAMLILLGWYQVDGIPIEETESFLSGDNFTSTEEEDGSLLFHPADSNGRGILIMHGALIMPLSYAKTAAYFAGLGYTVYVPMGPARLSIGAVDRAASRMLEMEPDKWFLIGHSMGAMASMEVATRHSINIQAIALWAGSMPSSYAHVDVPILYIWGDNDGLLPEERFKLSRFNLPRSVSYVTLEGANHKNFAMYSHQFFDKDAKIDWMEQIDFANQTTAEFFARYH
ncbi:MAG: alpha/beta hydrolase [Gammaproteobacteria bacterium]|jgi:pimeloyl-ACP methyl ester carboxylesterase|nr:alpha/beta hydrolase [Gammaproteobacteria bacterium]